MRTLVAAIVLMLGSALNCFAAASASHSSTLAEPAVLTLLGGGLVGLATLVRRHSRN